MQQPWMAIWKAQSGQMAQALQQIRPAMLTAQDGRWTASLATFTQTFTANTSEIVPDDLQETGPPRTRLAGRTDPQSQRALHAKCGSTCYTLLRLLVHRGHSLSYPAFPKGCCRIARVRSTRLPQWTRQRNRILRHIQPNPKILSLKAPRWIPQMHRPKDKPHLRYGWTTGRGT